MIIDPIKEDRIFLPDQLMKGMLPNSLYSCIRVRAVIVSQPGQTYADRVSVPHNGIEASFPSSSEAVPSRRQNWLNL